MKRKETNMKRSPLPKDADALLALAESVAATLSEYRDELGLSIDIEALLRAGISAATFSINTYLAVLAGATKSPVALGQLATARSRCERDIRLLRRRVMRSITQLRRYVKDRDLTRTTEHVRP
jgi:hypothetical protein